MPTDKNSLRLVVNSPPQEEASDVGTIGAWSEERPGYMVIDLIDQSDSDEDPAFLIDRLGGLWLHRDRLVLAVSRNTHAVSVVRRGNVILADAAREDYLDPEHVLGFTSPDDIYRGGKYLLVQFTS